MAAPTWAAKSAPTAELRTTDYTDLKVRIHARLLDLLNLSLLEKVPRDTLRPQIRTSVRALLNEEKLFLAGTQIDQLVEDVIDELLGLGPLEALLNDESISDILINTHEHVYVERAGRLEKTKVQFQDTRHLLRIINRIVSAVGRRVDESSPMVDARLQDGSRVNVIIPPLAVDGPLVSIRKFTAQPITMDGLVALGSLTAEMAALLSALVKARRNVLISGGTGSGKTTLLNALSAFIGERERIVTIEDSAELRLQQIHVGRLETRTANLEGSGEISQRDLLRNALRMRPDRIIVGEVRAGEAFDMLQAMNTGHHGSMTTVHANTVRDAMSRLEQMIGMAGLDVSPYSIRQQLASAIHVVIQVERMEDGQRRITSIAETAGICDGEIALREIVRFQGLRRSSAGAVGGAFEPTGLRPNFYDALLAQGISLPSFNATLHPA